MQIAAAAYLILVAVMSLVCFIAYGLDKRQAANCGRRCLVVGGDPVRGLEAS
jgi:uncharacterized membrane protein YsdA (DUF1294 family)